MNTPIPITNTRRLLEIFAVALTGIGKFVFMDYLDWRFFYISSACLFWISYIIYRYWKAPQLLKYWGLTSKNFKKTFVELLPVALILVVGFWFVGNALQTNILNWNILPLLIIYPIWGIIQQFVMIGILARNLKDMESKTIPDYLIVGITATIFAIVHYPFYLLIFATFFLALVYTTLYLKNRNLIVMGIYHGWVGAFFFYTILARDSWDEVFGNLQLF